MENSLPLIWVAIIAFGIFMYVLLDGFVLGIGILFRAVAREEQRDVMMNSVAPIWDGNETWLVLGGAALLAAFPLAYSVVLPALYLPLLLMLIALVFRGIAFEFRFKAERSKFIWDVAFNLGSVGATFTQGVVLGAFIQGFAVADRRYAGGSFDWLTGFSLMTGVALVAGYALLGAAWLIMKTEDALQAWAYRMTTLLLLAVVALIVIISLWVPFLDTRISERWFSWPNIVYLAPVPVLVVVVTAALFWALDQRKEVQPFMLVLALFLLSYIGLAISLWPHIIPPDISIWEAASPPATQQFLLTGVVFLVPMIVAYTGYSYWVFRGKIKQGVGYPH